MMAGNRKRKLEGRDDAWTELYCIEERHCYPDNEGKKTGAASRGGVIKQKESAVR